MEVHGISQIYQYTLKLYILYRDLLGGGKNELSFLHFINWWLCLKQHDHEGGGIGQWLACLGSRSGDPGSTPTEYISYTLGKGILPPLSRELCGRCMVIE